MAVRPLRFLGDPILRARSPEVDSVTDELRALISDMFETMYAEDGVGLAAPQIGVQQRVIVVDPREDDSVPIALVNPVIVATTDVTDRAEEGCLSLPGLKEIVERSVGVVVEGLDPDGAPCRVEADGLLSRVLQHEIDHIDGILFIDRVSPLKRALLLKRWHKVKPEEATG